jgi:BNR repeat-like domain
MHRHLILYLIAIALVSALLTLPARAQQPVVGPLIELSRPNAVGSCNTGFNLFGTWPTDDTEEPFVAVNPVHPNNIVAAWIQGPFQDIIAAVSFDGGHDWQAVPIPLTVCSGGSYPAAGDPWLSFAPNGDLYAIAIAGNGTSNGILVTKSSDGGLSWSAATLVSGNVDLPPDHPSITADPTDGRFVYAIWDGTSSGKHGPAVFSRTTDGGVTWEAPRTIVQTNTQSFIQFSQILVLPNGTLADIFELYEEQPNKPITFTNLQVLRSVDHGQTWSAPINAVTMTPLYRPNGRTLVVDPKTGQFVGDPTNPSFAVDGRNGNLYAVWEDGGFSNFQYNDSAFSMSADGGLTWSAPIRVNQTPLNIPPANRQSFFPSIAVAADGTIGVSYYDFRFNNRNNPNPGLPTDRWLVQCHPSSTSAATDPACWDNDVRLTDSSFNMEAVPIDVAGDFFFGDYFGLVTAGDDFVATFAQPDDQSVTSIFARRVGPASAGDPALNGIGSDPTTSSCRPLGESCTKNTECCGGFCNGGGGFGGKGGGKPGVCS